MDIFSLTKKTSPRHSHTQFWSNLRFWCRREASNKSLFESDLPKGPTQGKTFFFLRQMRCRELHWAPSPHCLHRIFRDFCCDSCFQKEALQFYPVGRWKTPFQGFVSISNRTLFVHFCQPHALRCVLDSMRWLGLKRLYKGGPLADLWSLLAWNSFTPIKWWGPIL